MFSACFLLFWAKCLILRRKKLCAFLLWLVAFVPFVVCPTPSDKPAGLYYARVLYNALGRALGISVQYPPCTFKVVKAV